MTVLSLAEALRVAHSLRDAGTPSAIATVVRSDAADVSVGVRAVFTAAGASAGALDPRIDAPLVSLLPDALPERESRMLSFQVETGSAAHVRIGTGNVDVYVEVVSPPQRLIIVGAGHIAVPLARIGKLIGFTVVVVDDRPEYASKERFPDADHLLIGPYRPTVSALGVDADSFVVLVTRGHVHDQACLEEVLNTDAPYIGMIGSKRRVRTVAQHLIESGYPRERVTAVHAPVGLDIGARTPAEIAVAIIAEIVALRRGRAVRSLALGERLRV